MHEVKLEQFEGPLSLLLKLIEENNFDITKISLAKVTDQYVSYIREVEEARSVDLADFLVVAAKLLYIKSKALMPFLIWDEEEEGDLEQQLKLYKEFLEASGKIRKMINKKRFTFAREKQITANDIIFNPPKSVNTRRLFEIFNDVLAKLEPIFELPKKLIEKTISIKEKIQQIKDLIIGQKSFSFNHLIETAENRTEIIVSFLAILELVKQNEADLSQEFLFEEIIIHSL
ncbi:MAG: segregation/condensation protein A [bacterium]